MATYKVNTTTLDVNLQKTFNEDFYYDFSDEPTEIQVLIQLHASFRIYENLDLERKNPSPRMFVKINSINKI